MKSRMIKMAGLILLLTSAFAPVVRAVDMESEEEWASGSVKKMEGSTLTLIEYDYETETDKTVVYIITPDTDFGEFTKKDIKEGVYLDVSYLPKNGKKQLTSVIISDESDSDPEEGAGDYQSE